MLLLIFDSKTAAAGAAEGIALCLQVAIPSLLPFLVLSMLLTSSLSGRSVRLLRPLGRLCGIPAGSEGLLIVGLLGGYPVGAQNVTAAYRGGMLSKPAAQRMLGFCSNAGPAFIFGITAGQFDAAWIPWALWGIHILSAVVVGYLLPGKEAAASRMKARNPRSLTQCVKESTGIMAGICGWIVLFRIVIGFLRKWFLPLLPQWAQVTAMGILELTNGCCSLDQIPNSGLRMIVASGLLAFGGLCVVMQTSSAVTGLGLGMYLPGKLLQSIISLCLAFMAQFLLPKEQQIALPATLGALFPLLLALLGIICREYKKRVAFRRSLVYNEKTQSRNEATLCCSANR